MEKLEIFLLIYVLVFFKDIMHLPGKAGATFFKGITAIMLLLSVFHISYLKGYLPWPLYENSEVAWGNLYLNLTVALLAYSYSCYMKLKPKTNDAAEYITPSSLRNLLEMYRFREVKDALWFVLIPVLIFTKILMIYNLSTTWCVLLGTIAVFMIVYALYEVQKWIIDRASPFEDVPNRILNEWLSRDYYTEEEQGLLRARLVKMQLLKETC